MNNGGGQNNNNPKFSVNDLTLVDPNSVVTPELYASNMQYIQDLRAHLVSYEERLTAGYAKYRDLEERQRLEETVRQGELAAQLLAQIDSGRGSGAAPVPASAGPPVVQQSMFTSQFHGQAAVDYNEVPSSARIVEVPSSQDSPQKRASTTPSSRSETHAPVNQLRVPVASYNASRGSAYSHGQMQDWVPFGASPSVMYGRAQPPAPHSQQASYQSGQWATPPSAHYRPQPHYPMAQPQPSSVASSSSRTPQQALHAGSQQAGRVPQGASGPSRSAAAPSSSSSTQLRGDSVDRSNVPQSSRPASRSGQTQQPTSISPQLQQQLFQFFQKFPVREVNAMMIQIITVLRRKQAGRVKAAAEIEAEGKVNVSIIKAAEAIADYLKGYPESEVSETFRKCLTQVNAQQQATARPEGGRSSSVEKPPTQHPQQPIPSTSTTTRQPAPPPQPNGVQAQPPAAIRPPVSQQTTKPPYPAPPAVAAPAASTSVSVPATFTAPSTSSTTPAGGPFTQISWYTPRDLTAPVMVRNARGQIQWIHRQNVLQPAASSVPAEPLVPSTPPASKAAAGLPPISQSQPELPATPQSQPRPTFETNAWTPEKADRSRLAQDIMRSLGRPKGAFGAPLSPTDATSPSWFEDIHLPTDTSTATLTLSTPTATATATTKRKAYPSPAGREPVSPTAVKRPRLDGQQEELELTSIGGTTAGGSPEVAAVDGAVSAAVVSQEAEVPVADGAVAEPLLPSPVKQEVEEDVGVDTVDHILLPGLTDVDSVRGVSITSSEAANIERTLDVFISEPVPVTLQDDTVGIPAATPSPLQELSAPASNATPPPSSPAPSLHGKGKEKEPLFLPSPSGSPGPSVYDEDEGMRSDVSAAPRLLGSRKGKGRALDLDLDLHQPVDGDEISEASSFVPRRRRRTNRAYVLVPPLPEYASSLRGNEIVWWGSQSPSSSVASGSRSGPPSAHSEESADELAEWRVSEEVGSVVETEPDDEEAEAAAQLSFSRVRETRCSWDGCGLVLNSVATLQKHLELHAAENEEWGTFCCRWKSCLSSQFKDKQSLVRHLQKHTKSPLWCAYEDCDHSFTSASDLLHHHQSSRHHDGQLRKSYCPAPPPENRRQLSELPNVVPAYMFAVRPVRKHPVSRDRHQWVGPKVLENITSFKYTGRRSNAAHPSRLSRRLAEKVAAVELASVTPESGHAQIRRWIDDEYLDFADGYDASRRTRLWCADIPAGEVTQMVHDGLALFVDANDWDARGEEGGEKGEADQGGLGGGGQERDTEDRHGSGEGATGPEENEKLPPLLRSEESSPARTNAGTQPLTTRLKPKLPRSNVIRLPPRPNQSEAAAENDRDADTVAGNDILTNPDQLDGRKAPETTPASQSPVSAQTQRSQPPETPRSSPQHLVSVPEASRDEVLGSVWTVWPPAKEESVETR